MKTYKFNELSKNAKKAALENKRHNLEYFGWPANEPLLDSDIELIILQEEIVFNRFGKIINY